MPRKPSSPPKLDLTAAVEFLQEYGVKRRQFVKARIRVMNAAGALVRRGLGWNAQLSETESAKLSQKAATIIAADDPSTLKDKDMAAVGVALLPDILVAKAMAAPGEAHQAKIEKEMRAIARQFPVWESWGESVKGFSDLGLALIIAEAGDLTKYSDHSKLWKRLGLAPFTKDGETRSMSMWRMKKGLSAEDWTTAGYVPRRRATLFSQVGGPLIGFMNRGYRPLVGEDIDANDSLSHYQRIFVHRLRYEAARDPEMRRPDRIDPKTGEVRESFSRVCARRAQYYTEKRFVRDLWRAWREATLLVPEKAEMALPSADQTLATVPVPQGQNYSANAGKANRLLPDAAKEQVPSPDNSDPPSGGVVASQNLPKGPPRRAATTTPRRRGGKATERMPETARTAVPSLNSGHADA